MGVNTYSPTFRAQAARGDKATLPKRIGWLAGFMALGGLALIGRFFQLQVLDGKIYKVLASDQHELQSALIPKRGTVFLRDRHDGTLYPIAKDRDSWLVFAMPREVKEAEKTADQLGEWLHATSSDILLKIASPTSSYAVIAKDVGLELAEKIKTERLPGIGVSRLEARMYPEQGLGGHTIGFVGPDEKKGRAGRYGIEGHLDDLLAGKAGSLVAEKDAAGRRLAIGSVELSQAEDGADVVLTIDRTIQYFVCKKMQEAVREFQAESASVVILDPDTGAVLAMCAYPDFDPGEYGKTKEISTFNNPVTFAQFEPGSIFKPLTLAAGLDTDKITPRTTYTDKGEETMDGFTIRNSDKMAHGLQTMTAVLDKSLNTGTIFVQRLLGREVFRDYMKRFGMGEKTGIELPAEAKGNIASLDRTGKIFAATASFGQGISVTPIQMVAAFAALGNGGKLYRPYIVQEIVYPDGRREVTKPEVVREPIRPRTSRLIAAMMVAVVENGHGKRAAVPGYYIAGKTGTAQIPNPNGKGYLEDATIGSFIGFGPAENPKFIMLVRIDKPTTVRFAESSAAPVFGEIAQFLMTYLQVPPERAIAPPPPKLIEKPTASTSSH